MFLPGLFAAVIAQAESQALRDAARAIEDTNALIDSLAALEQLDNLRSSTSHLRGSHEGGGDGDAGVFDPSSVSSHAPPADATATAPVLPKRMGAAAWHPTWSPPSDAVVVGEDAAPRAVPRELPAALPLSTLHAHWGTSATTAAKHAANHGVQGAAVADLARNPELNPCKCVEGDTCDWKKTTPVRLEFCFVFLCKQVVRIHSPFPAAFLPPSCCLRSACICGARAYRRPSPTHSLDSPSVLASSLSLSLLPTSLLLSLFLFYPTLPLLLAHTLSRTHTQLDPLKWCAVDEACVRSSRGDSGHDEAKRGAKVVAWAHCESAHYFWAQTAPSRIAIQNLLLSTTAGVENHGRPNYRAAHGADEAAIVAATSSRSTHPAALSAEPPPVWELAEKGLLNPPNAAGTCGSSSPPCSSTCSIPASLSA